MIKNKSKFFLFLGTILIGFFIVGAYIIHITVTITRQNKMIVKLTQELAILKEKLNKK